MMNQRVKRNRLKFGTPSQYSQSTKNLIYEIDGLGISTTKMMENYRKKNSTRNLNEVSPK